MIIKRKRIKARGPALKRALLHVMDGEDNDAVELVRGNIEELEDARADALRFGREYAVRHWILSPSQRINDEQLTELIERLAVEFGFDPDRAVAWKHTKKRASEASDEHYHLCVPEVDPVAGGVMSSAHDFARQEKIARSVELSWGHVTVPGRHMVSVVAALEKEAPSVANSLHQVAAPEHSESFDEADHQRLKRAGVDLPRTREMISAALSDASDPEDFGKRLKAIGLRIRKGDRSDNLIVETITEATLVGSLSRLTRLRKKALLERMAFNATEKPKADPNDPSSHVLARQAVAGTDGAGRQISGGLGEFGSSGSDGHHDRSAAADGQRDRENPHSLERSGNPFGRSYDLQIAKRSSRLRLQVQLVRHQSSLLDLLGAARRSALTQLERLQSDLNDVVESESVTIHRLGPLAEPASLIAARQKNIADSGVLRALEVRLAETIQKLNDCQPRSRWNFLINALDDPERRRLESRIRKFEGRILEATAARSASAEVLKGEITKFNLADARHQAGSGARQKQCEDRVADARLAGRLLERNASFARFTGIALLRLASMSRSQHAESSATATTRLWDLQFDEWGTPLLPPAAFP